MSSESMSEKAFSSSMSPLRQVTSNFMDSRIAIVSLGVLILVVIAALLAPWLSIQNPYDLAQIDIMDSRLVPGSKSLDGNTYWLGTDDQGRDMVSAILYGLRISLWVGILSGAAAFALGTLIGLLGTYAGGRLDALIMRAVDIQLGFPPILIALILLALLGRGVDKVLLALILSQWAFYARTVRATALVEREKEYMEAARNLELPPWRILIRHLLPNCLPPLIVVSTVNVANAIQLEATLSFLGVGLPITEPSLGLLIANGFQYILSGQYWISVFPGIALLIAVASINLVADRLRDVLNPRGQR
ncbi:ABC transporter permease [Desulfospira joergensenii]|uniref:ABC transporter permease n=1 Tax=Desulfospira joergensenii TaxID=53329 RepID=UPI0003B68AC3|nr:ABC transporter permease [Desulfospira joergensenii]